ncbi:MAG: ATP-binding protein [Candidatus Sulfotelmatobacter sp.]
MRGAVWTRGLKVVLSKRQNLPERYTIAFAIAVVAVLLRWALDPFLGHVAFYVTVYMAVALVSLIWGLGPAALTTVVGFFGILYRFVDPRHSLLIRSQAEIHGVIGFFLVSTVLIILGEANRRKQYSLNNAVVALTLETKERQKAEEALRKSHSQLEERVTERTAALSQALAKVESQVAERKEAEDRLRQLSTKLMTLQDEERRRIARDLHDTTGQTLAATKMILATLQRAGAAVPDVYRLAGELNVLIDEASREIRTTSYLLHPPLLDELGIASASKWFVEGFAKRSGISVHCDIPEGMQRLSRNCELALFRVLQECLTNIHRYSEASTAGVRLRLDDGKLIFEVSDNGRGIAEDRLRQLHGSDGNAGVGIAGMRERIRELGGHFEIDSGKSGTIVSVVIPISKAADSTKRAGGFTAA